MTKVVFHMGLNKAGSSYLQSLFQHNFAEHGPSGIFYPGPHLGSGNASFLAKAIRALDKDEAIAALRDLLDHAQPGETVLLSTEFMYHQFVKLAQRDMMHACFSELGIEDLTLVCVFRNVEDHAVSAYCHRCGVHAIPPFETWIAETAPTGAETGADFKNGVICYEFWGELRLFLAAARDERFQLCYMPHSNQMEQRWEQILGYALTAPKSRAVNVSVCPSEAEVLRRLHDTPSLKYGDLREQFKAVGKREKADDSALLNHYHNLIGAQVTRHADMIAEAEAILGFNISTPPAGLVADNGHSVVLSDVQMDILIATLQAAKTARKPVKDRIRDATPAPLRPLAQRLYRALRG